MWKEGLFIMAFIVFGMGCVSIKTPKHVFADKEPFQAMDYSKDIAWAASPFLKDFSDSLPDPSLSVIYPDSSLADVFFIHPTTYFKSSHWNAPVDNRKLNGKTDKSTILHQASVFNGSCRIFAPRYRQMTYYGFFGDPNEMQKALDLAYQDIVAAFNHYLENYNNGRPFIIAGHSQGTLLAIRLLNEKIGKSIYSNKLIAAYLVGWPIKPGDMDHIVPCLDSSSTGCFVSWNSFAYGYIPKNRYTGLFDSSVCTNPLIWAMDTLRAGFELNKGLLNRQFNELIPGLADAKCSNGLLWVETGRLPGLAKKMKRLHIADYNLFWMNIRINIEQRIKGYYLSKGNEHRKE